MTPAARGYCGPARYIQGPGVFNQLGALLERRPGPVLAIVDGFLADWAEERLHRAFAGTGRAWRLERFGGECCQSEVDRLVALAGEAGVVVGVGGGKTLDTAKLVAVETGAAMVVAPTAASTDAPTSAMSVLYKETGEHLRAICHGRSPDLVLVDSEIIARAPLRLFRAGLGDALSTWFEARANDRSDTANYVGAGYQRTKAGLAIARMCFDVLMADAEQALADLGQGRLTAAVENVIEANILLSGLGFENTGCAAAHAIHTGFHEIPAASQSYHGEIVAFGVLFQLVLEQAPREEVAEMLRFFAAVGLPMTLRQLHVEPTEANIAAITARVVDGNSGIEAEPFPITAEAVRRAIAQADALGRDYLARTQGPVG
jgi:glycerol dehydrogenase